jgi:predicted Fe-S protein YdhL (DUF1289 family)
LRRIHDGDAFTHESAMASDTLLSMDRTLTTPAAMAALSPCIGICSLGDDGLCAGCLRTGAEIGAWSRLPDAERRRIMDEVLPLRGHRRD